MKSVCIFLIVLAFARAQIPSLGFCPEYLPMAHFDMNRFLGKWYEASRYFQFSEVAARCVVTDYAKAANGRIFVSNEVTNRLTGIKRVIGGNLELSGKKNEGKLNVKYQTTPISTETSLTVLDTDYDTYAVIWSCSGFGPINAQSAWLMTRDRLPDQLTMQQAYGVLDKFKISRTFFVKTDQEGCAIAASDLNAALGITSTSTVIENYEEQKSTDVSSNLVKNADEKPENQTINVEKNHENVMPVKPETLSINSTTSMPIKRAKPEEFKKESKVEEPMKEETINAE